MSIEREIQKVPAEARTGAIDRDGAGCSECPDIYTTGATRNAATGRDVEGAAALNAKVAGGGERRAGARDDDGRRGIIRVSSREDRVAGVSYGHGSSRPEVERPFSASCQLTGIDLKIPVCVKSAAG